MSHSEIAEQLLQYALDHYEEDGWDYLVETYERHEIVEILREDRVQNLSDAIKAFGFLKIKDDMRKDAMACI